MPSKKWLSIQEIAPLFHRPIVDVAATLGVCTTVLKKVCRRHGIRRWPQRKLQSLNKLINNLHNAMKSTNVAEEHQRLACEIANLQTRKAILTAPIVRSGGMMEPSQEEILAEQQDRSGGADPLAHAHMVAEHARIQLREGGTVNSPARGGASRRDDDGDSDGDAEMDEENGASAQATQDDGSTVALLMKMRANTGSGSNKGSCGASPNDPTPPTVSATSCGERVTERHAAGGWGATDRIGGMPADAAGLSGGLGAAPDPLSRISKSNGLQRAANSSPKGAPFAGLAPLAPSSSATSASRSTLPAQPPPPYLDAAVSPGAHPGYQGMGAAELQLALSRGMLASQVGGLPGRAPGRPPAQVQQAMHEQMNLQMMMRMQSSGLAMGSQVAPQISGAPISPQLVGGQLANARQPGPQGQPSMGMMVGGKPSYTFPAAGWPSPTQASPLASPLMPGGSVPASPQLQLQLQQLQQQMLQQQMAQQQAQHMQHAQLKQQAHMQHLQLALQQQQQLLGTSPQASPLLGGGGGVGSSPLLGGGGMYSQPRPPSEEQAPQQPPLGAQHPALAPEAPTPAEPAALAASVAAIAAAAATASAATAAAATASSGDAGSQSADYHPQAAGPATSASAAVEVEAGSTTPLQEESAPQADEPASGGAPSSEAASLPAPDAGGDKQRTAPDAAPAVPPVPAAPPPDATPPMSPRAAAAAAPAGCYPADAAAPAAAEPAAIDPFLAEGAGAAPYHASA